jgi:predicted amidohydrolase
MRIAVVQHALRASAAEDAAALAEAARAAEAAGADVVVMPEVPSLRVDAEARDKLYDALEGLAGIRIIPAAGPGHDGIVFVADPVEGAEELGSIALLIGDAAFRGREWLGALAKSPKIGFMFPRSESDLQAEAAFEVALAFSDSLCGVIAIAECAGAEPGDVGHGGSAIIQLGNVVAEAGDGDDLLVADIETPVAQPEPREPLPTVPPLLTQRLAVHAGQRPSVEYLADLSEGSGAR